jgi:hypothetical protein
MVTEGGQFYPRLADQGEDVFFIPKFYRDAVNSYVFRCLHQLASLTAPKEQVSAQAPHLMHLAPSMTKGSLVTPLIAPTGQARAQLEQP